MKKTRIVTDGSVHFPDPEIPRTHRINVVPYSIDVDTRTMTDGLGNISPERYLDHVAKSNARPEVRAPTIDAFTESFRTLEHSKTDVLCLCASRHLSDAWNNAKSAADIVQGKIKIVVIDSLTTSIGLGLMIEAATNAISSGASIEEAAYVVRKRIPNVYGIFFMESMQYLQYGGWVGPAQSTLATMLGVKPIFALESGGFIPFEKVRTRTQALERLMEFATEFPEIEQLTVLRGRARVASAARQLRTRLGDIYPHARITNAIFGPILAALIGPDGLGIILCEHESSKKLGE